jgi:hypothetical protein
MTVSPLRGLEPPPEAAGLTATLVDLELACAPVLSPAFFPQPLAPPCGPGGRGIRAACLYRNPPGVALKLLNLRAIETEGLHGMNAYSQLDAAVWRDYVDDLGRRGPGRCHRRRYRRRRLSFAELRPVRPVPELQGLEDRHRPPSPEHPGSRALVRPVSPAPITATSKRPRTSPGSAGAVGRWRSCQSDGSVTGHDPSRDDAASAQRLQ